MIEEEVRELIEESEIDLRIARRRVRQIAKDIKWAKEALRTLTAAPPQEHTELDDTKEISG